MSIVSSTAAADEPGGGSDQEFWDSEPDAAELAAIEAEGVSALLAREWASSGELEAELGAIVAVEVERVEVLPVQRPLRPLARRRNQARVGGRGFRCVRRRGGEWR
jgi:hypothetical protein